MVLWPAAVADFPLGTANALTLTSRNTVAVAGVVQGSFAVLEFDTDTGTLVSRGVLPGAGEARSVAFDGPEGSVVAGGSIRPTAFGFLVAVAKFDSNGTALWSENIGPANLRGQAALITCWYGTRGVWSPTRRPPSRSSFPSAALSRQLPINPIAQGTPHDQLLVTPRQPR